MNKDKKSPKGMVQSNSSYIQGRDRLAESANGPDSKADPKFRRFLKLFEKLKK